MKIALLTSVGTLLGVLAAGPVAAAENYGVSLKQTDFQSADGVRQLHQRIRREARRACPNFTEDRNLRASAVCRAEVEADLIGKIDHPLLNAYLQSEDSLRIALDQRRQSGSRS